MSKDALIVVDFGSSALKVQAVTFEGDLLAEEKEKPTIVKDESSLSVEYDSGVVTSLVLDCLRLVNLKVQRLGYKVRGIGCTSQRFNMVLLDREGRVLCMSPNNDPRGFLARLNLNEQDLRKLYSLTGLCPPQLFAPARLKWFEDYNAGVLSRVAKIMTMCDYLVYTLCDRIVTDPTSAAGSMLFDVRKGSWCTEALEIFGVEENSLPEVTDTGEVVGYLSEKVASKTALPKDVPVVVCGGDTQSAFFSMHVFDADDAGVVMGHTIPVGVVTNEPRLDEQMRTWLTPLLRERWLVESNAGPLGLFVEWSLGNIFRSSDFSILDGLAELAPPGAKGLLMKLYPSISDVKILGHQDVRGLISLPPLASPFSELVGLEDVARSLIEFIVFSVKANLNQALTVARRKLKRVAVTGGLTRLTLMRKLLPSVLSFSTEFTKHHYGTALGCAAMVARALGYYASLEDAVRAMSPVIIVEPIQELKHCYEPIYTSWLSFYTSQA
ncbi:MAG: FGGY-family carbohydrate kinase [Thermofilaceae archaeon]|nr:FGGY-family carbohydrate kinase [Thermofilaceae archaeon]MCX8180278.1 FGGY-family carbohydrate kinase [Thermofilaceae archaeon]MDW8004002.1 FGGY-family carbohydrate kinase [Thermofilaceae archaeon]